MDVIRFLVGRTWIHVLVGALLMGCWAAVANRMHDPADILRTAGLQAVLSGALTAGLKTVADHLLDVLPHWMLAGALSLLLSAGVLLKAHVMAGTPELAATVAVPLLVSGSYIFIYSYLRRGAPDG